MTPGCTVWGLFHFARPGEVHWDGELGRPTAQDWEIGHTEG